MSDDTPSTVEHRPRGRLAPAFVTVGLMLVFVIPASILVLNRFDEMGAISRGYDEVHHHLPIIHRFSAELPSPDFSDYPAAMTPGYHFVLAVVHRFVSDDIRVLRFVGGLLTVVLIGLFGWMVARHGMRHGLPGWEAGLVALPALVSVYVFPCGVWLVPDNAGWLGVMVILALVLGRAPRPVWLVIGGALLVLLVVVRQSHLWAAGFLWLAAWLGMSLRDNDLPGRGFFDGGMLPSEADPLKRKLGRLALAFAVSVPAFVVLVYFVRLWGGLVPPSHQPGSAHLAGTAYVQTFNPTALGMAALVVGVWSVVFSGYLVPRLVTVDVPMRMKLGFVGLGGLVGVLVGVLPVSEPTLGGDLTRASGYWGVIRLGPVFFERSPLFALGSIVGGLAAGAWMVVLPARRRWVLMGAVAGVAIACAAIPVTWQRYSEPLIMMVIALCVANTRRPEGMRGLWERIDRLAWIGPLVTTAVFVVVLVRWMSPG